MNSEKQLRWDRHFMELALEHAKMSKDPSTQVGAIIVGPNLDIRSAGFNGFPRGIQDLEERLTNKAVKYKLVVHAELNAILAAARIGSPLHGCSLYVADSGLWGGPPCIRCAMEIIQAGIVEIIGRPKRSKTPRWSEDKDTADLPETEALLKEAGIRYREVI